MLSGVKIAESKYTSGRKGLKRSDVADMDTAK
jgi:hypothetical protein